MRPPRTVVARLVVAGLALLLPLLPSAAPAAPAASSTAAPPVHLAGEKTGRLAPRPEVWQRAQPAYPENRGNPLARRRWGVYQGPMEQAWKAYERATGDRRQLLGKIALRPKATWIGAWSGSPAEIEPKVRDHIRRASGGDPNVLVQLSVFRMRPWEGEACERVPTLAERREYRQWIQALARAIGAQSTAIVLQPDLPFLGCVPDRRISNALIRFASKTLSELPNTSVYLDAGASDWSSTPQTGRPRPEQIADLLAPAGIRFARGFALNSTHYTGVADDVRYGARLVEILSRRGMGTKHFVVDTAKNGVPMRWSEVIPSAPHEKKDNARVCTTPQMRRCVTMGIPPTVQVAHFRWKLPTDVRDLARRHVDGYLWFGRPWLYYQADPFKLERALPMARTTPWPGPLV